MSEGTCFICGEPIEANPSAETNLSFAVAPMVHVLTHGNDDWSQDDDHEAQSAGEYL